MSSGTFSQIYIQLVFAVSGRQSLIEEAWEEELYKYITGIISNKGQKLLAINGMPDHIHILIGMKPSCQLSNLVMEIKKSSNKYINEKKFTKYTFSWQVGYGAFSYSHSNFGNVINYIKRQKEHHKRQTFLEEYQAFLQKFEIEFQSAYVFDAVD